MRTEVIPQEQRSQTNTADYVLYLNFQVAGATESKAEGTLTGIKAQTAKYATGLPDNLPATRRPLPFLFEPFGIETFSPVTITFLASRCRVGFAPAGKQAFTGRAVNMGYKKRKSRIAWFLKKTRRHGHLQILSL